jgi:hypothetical protein
VVDNKETLEKLPNIEGLLSYRTDNKDLLLRGKHSWNRMAKENQVTIHGKVLRIYSLVFVIELLSLEHFNLLKTPLYNEIISNKIQGFKADISITKMRLYS